MARLPTNHADGNQWGQILNEYLSVTHSPTGSLKAFLSVEDFGALGDDSTDDAGAIQAAIDAAWSAGGGTVWIPAHFVCKVVPSLHGRALTARPGVTVASAGGTLRVPNSNPKYFAIISHTSTDDVSGFKLIGLTIDQNGANNVSSDPLIANEYCFTLMIMKGQDFLVRDCTFENIDGLNTLDFNGSTIARVSVLNNTFTNVGGPLSHDHSTIYTQGTSVLIQGNRFHARLNGGACSPSAVCAIETHGSYTNISDNVIVNYRDGVNYTGVAIKTDVSTCSGNVIYRAQRGINLYPIQYSTGVSPAYLGATVNNNVVYIDPDFWAADWPQWTTGISVVSAADMAVEGLTISDNVIRFAPYTGTSTSVAALLSSGIVYSRTGGTTHPDREISITGNTVSGAIACGIYAGGYVEGVTVSGNTISNCGHATLAVDDYKAGISMFGHALRAVVSNNNIYDTRTNGPQRYGIAWNCDSSSTGGFIANNNIVLTNTTSARELNVAATSGSPYVSHRATSGTNVSTPAGAVAFGSRWVGVASGAESTQSAYPSGGSWLAPRRKPSERWVSPRSDSAVQLGSPTSGYMCLIPVDFNFAELINGLAWEITTQGVDAAGSTDDLRFGLYADSGRDLPTGAPLFTSAVQNLESTAPGVVTLAVSWQLPNAGRFWLAVVRQVTGSPATAAVLRCSTASAGSQPFTSEATAPTFGTVGGPSSRLLVQTGVTGSLPSIGTLATTGGLSPVLAFKVA